MSHLPPPPSRREPSKPDSARGRSRAAIAIGWAFFVVAVASMLVYALGAAVAYLANASGLWKLAGLVSPISGLFLPYFGRGEIAGVTVHSFIWWWLVLGFVIGWAFSSLVGPFQVVIQYDGPDDETHWMSLTRFDSIAIHVLEHEPDSTAGRIAAIAFGVASHSNTVAVETAMRGLTRNGVVAAGKDGEGTLHYSIADRS